MYTFFLSFLLLVPGAALGCELKFNLGTVTNETPEAAGMFFEVTSAWKTNKIYFFDDASGTAASKRYFIRLRLRDVEGDKKADLVFKNRGDENLLPTGMGQECETDYLQRTPEQSCTIKYKIKNNRFEELRLNLPPNGSQAANAYFNEFSGEVSGDWNAALSPPSRNSGQLSVVGLADLVPMGPIESRTKKFKLPCEGTNSFRNDEGDKKFEMERWEFDGTVSYEASVKVDPTASGLSCAELSAKFARCLGEASTPISSSNLSKTDQFMPLIHSVAFPSTNCDH